MELGHYGWSTDTKVFQQHTTFLERPAPVMEAYGTLNVGASPFDGLSTGAFAGSGFGTTLAINATAGFSGNLADWQVSGTSVFTVSARGQVVATDVVATGLSGATAASRYAGATASGAPVSGSFLVGDFVIDQTGKAWVCTGAGSPGTWAQLAGSGSPLTTKGDLYGYSTVDARIPIGADGTVLTADSAQALGVRWATVTGTVTSVALSAPSEVTVTGSPVTGAGTVALTWANESANQIFAGPTTGTATTPGFRALVANDIPNLDTAKMTTGALALARGGTAVDNSTGIAQHAVWAGPSASSGTASYRALVASDIPSLAASIITSGILAQAQGGTNLDTSAVTDGQLLIGQTSDHTFGLATLTQGANVTITNAGHSISIAAAGSVSSVAMTVPSPLTVTGTPVTSSGTLAVIWASGQTANQVLATPDSTTGAVSLRALVANDIPDLSAAKITSGTLALARGGTAVDNTSVTANRVWAGPTTGAAASASYRALVAADIPALSYGTGTVTSVGLSAPAEMSVGSSPVTTSGTLALTWANESANQVFAGPTTGVATTPGFRALVANDIPNLDAGKITTGALALVRGGTAVDNSTGIAQHAVWAGPSGSSGSASYRALVASDIPSLAASIITSGILAQAQGGTGIDSSAATDGQLLVGKTSDHSLRLATLTAGAGISVTNGAASITVSAGVASAAANNVYSWGAFA